MIKTGTSLLFLQTLTLTALAQTAPVQQVNKIIALPTAVESIHFLAADELRGRGPFGNEVHVAARYIAEQLRSAGAKPFPTAPDYFQVFPFHSYQTPNQASITVGGKTFRLGTDLVQSGGSDTTLSAPAVLVTKDALATTDVKGKIVVTNDNLSNQALQEKGALAKVVRFKQGGTPWSEYLAHFTGERPVNSFFRSYVVNDEGNALTTALGSGTTTLSVSTSGAQHRASGLKNVLGYVEGTDPQLKNQYIVLTAHYDHVGVAKTAKVVDGKADSIYNGARDNAVGVAAIINAARYFAQHPPKRSVLFIAYGGEEGGMLGSRYFAANPVVPMRQLVFNMNIDNAGYNDTTVVTVVGLGRTSADEHFKKAASALGLSAIPDPSPEQGLFDRSDNVSLAVHGVPAPTFSLGFRAFDASISRYYHQVTDETSSLSMPYVLKYIKAYVLAAKYIADDKAQPTWIKGDKYEAAANTLYK